MESGIETIRVIWQLSLFGMDISITSAVLVIWSAVIIIFTFCYLAVQEAAVLPNKAQNLLEIIYEFWDEQTKELFESQSQTWLPFIISLFAFVLVCNLLGMIPNVYPITANINLTVTLAVLVFIAYHVAGVKTRGAGNYLKSLVPAGVPVFILPLMIVIELLGHLARPFSLAIRLFANMTAGHLVAFTLLSLIFVSQSVWLAGFPFLGRIAIGLFEVFVAFIQAYIFAYLAALYIGLAIQQET